MESLLGSSGRGAYANACVAAHWSRLPIRLTAEFHADLLFSCIRSNFHLSREVSLIDMQWRGVNSFEIAGAIDLECIA
jgi:hypothetical protein